MGFRSTMTTEHYYQEIPQWFLEKYPDLAYGAMKEQRWSFPISLRGERKFYDKFSEQEIFVDIQKILREKDIDDISVVLLHECGGITLVKIGRDKISGREPVEWKEVEMVEHNYCYGCSEPAKNTT